MSSLSAASSAAYQAPAVWRVLTEVGYFAWLCALLGALLPVLTVVLPAAASSEGAEVAAPAEALRRRALGMFTVVGPLMLVALYFQTAAVAARRGDLAFADALQPGAIWDFLRTPKGSGEWIGDSTLRAAQIALIAAASVVAAVAGRLRSRPLAVVALVTVAVGEVVVSVPTAFDGMTIDDWLSTVLIQVHILSGVSWVGGLGVLAYLGLRGRQDTAGSWARIWSRFSVLAMTCAGGILVSGMWLAWQGVGSLTQFVTTAYGRFLLAKIAMVGLMLFAGGYNQTILLPRVARAVRARDDGSVRRAVLEHFPRIAAAEAVLGLGVLFIVPFLAGSARGEAGGSVGPLDGGTFTVGLLLIAAMLGSFWATGRIAKAQEGRPDSVERQPVSHDRSTVG